MGEIGLEFAKAADPEEHAHGLHISALHDGSWKVGRSQLHSLPRKVYNCVQVGPL
jgi:hypothetical protein